MEETRDLETPVTETRAGDEEPRVYEEIAVEELAIDGICGVY
ncbi:MAG: variant-type mycofactocin precursor [Deferrisomatales bacterium]